MKKENLNIGISTINLFLIIMGYALVTTVFLPMGSDISGISRAITIPFRLVSLVISLLVIGLNIQKKIKLDLFVKLLLIFWGLYILKLFVVITLVPTTVATQFNSPSEYYLYAIGIVLIPMISVLYSYQKININALFHMTYFSGLIILLISMQSNNLLYDSDDMIRQRGNIALNAISYGHVAITIALLSIYRILFKPNKWFQILFYAAGLLFSLYIAFRTGSRGPAIAFVFTGAVLMFSRFKNSIIGLCISAIFILSLIIFWDSVNSFIESVSPIMAERLSQINTNESDRMTLFNNAWEQFLENPLFGKDFVLTSGFGQGYYPHNIIIESFMSLGIFGGILLVIIIIAGIYKSVYILKRKSMYGLFSVIFLQYIILHMFSGNIYAGNTFFCLLILILQVTKSEIRNEEEMPEASESESINN